MLVQHPGGGWLIATPRILEIVSKGITTFDGTQFGSALVTEFPEVDFTDGQLAEVKVWARGIVKEHTGRQTERLNQIFGDEPMRAVFLVVEAIIYSLIQNRPANPNPAIYIVSGSEKLKRNDATLRDTMEWLRGEYGDGANVIAGASTERYTLWAAIEAAQSIEEINEVLMSLN